jgi:type II secretory pathway pseudopilin PulG
MTLIERLCVMIVMCVLASMLSMSVARAYRVARWKVTTIYMYHEGRLNRYMSDSDGPIIGDGPLEKDGVRIFNSVTDYR